MLLSSAQLALTPGSFPLGEGRLAPRLSYQHDWYMFGLASSKEVTVYDFSTGITKTSDLGAFDFNAQITVVVRRTKANLTVGNTRLPSP